MRRLISLSAKAGSLLASTGEGDEVEDASVGGHTGHRAPTATPMADRGPCLGGGAGRRVLPGWRMVLLGPPVSAGPERRRETRREAHLQPQRGGRDTGDRHPSRSNRSGAAP